MIVTEGLAERDDVHRATGPGCSRDIVRCSHVTGLLTGRQSGHPIHNTLPVLYYIFVSSLNFKPFYI